MPELPDVVVYVEALTERVAGRRLERLQILSPFVLRSVEPPVAAVEGRVVREVRRLGKRIVLGFAPPPGASDEAALFLVIHLMIAGRLRWRETPGSKPAVPRTLTLAIFTFPGGSLFFTEASSTRRASLQIVRGAAALAALDAGGIDPLAAGVEEFGRALSRENHTLKRALTDPHVFSGIGNAYSDEILHAARLSPAKLTRTLSAEEIARLAHATRATLGEWTDRLRRQNAGRFPEKVTAFHEEMAVHGRFRKPCPVCGAPIQRIVRGGGENECNYCPTCQTGGRPLADRSLSRLGVRTLRPVLGGDEE